MDKMDTMFIEVTADQRDDLAHLVRKHIQHKLGLASRDYSEIDEATWEKHKGEIDSAYALLRAMGAVSEKEQYRAEVINSALENALGTGVAEWRDNTLHILKDDTPQDIQVRAIRIATNEEIDIPF